MRPYAIYNNEIMVGFIMLAYMEADDGNEENVYWVCRLMIDKAHQGNGYSKEAMKKAIELIRTFLHGKASEVCLSYKPGNLVAKTLYTSIDFTETGKVDDGEIVAKMIL